MENIKELLEEFGYLADFVDALLDSDEKEAHDLLVNSGEDVVERAREIIAKYQD